MNAELFSQGFSAVIILMVIERTTFYRFGLLLADREFSPYKKSLSDLKNRNWFCEPSDAKLIES
jgi:hypothetical protein